MTQEVPLTKYQQQCLPRVIAHGKEIADELNAFYDSLLTPAPITQSILSSHLNDSLGLNLPRSAMSVGFATAVRLGCFPGLQSACKAGTKRIAPITFQDVQRAVIVKKAPKPKYTPMTPNQKRAVYQTQQQTKRIDRLLNRVNGAIDDLTKLAKVLTETRQAQS